MTFPISLPPYELIYDESLQIVKAWKNDCRVKVTQALNDEMWENFEDEIRAEAEKHIAPEFEGADYFETVPQQYR